MRPDFASCTRADGKARGGSGGGGACAGELALGLGQEEAMRSWRRYPLLQRIPVGAPAWGAEVQKA